MAVITTVSTIQSNATGNETAQEAKSQGYVGMIVITFVLALIFNMCALFMIIRSSKHHKWSAFYRLMIALNISDLFGSITSFPVLLATYANDVIFPGGKALCDYNGYMISLVFLSSASIVGTMSAERFIGVWFPFFYNDTHAKKIRTNVVLAVIWITVAFIALLPVVGFGEYVLQYPGTWCFYNFRATTLSSKVYAYMYSIIWILVIFFTILFNILVILKLLRRMCFATSVEKQNRQSSQTNRNEIFSIVLLGLIVVVTAVCGIPLSLRAIVNESGSKKDDDADLHASRMASFNMIMDPLVYILFRRENLEWLLKCIRRRRDQQEKTTSSSGGSSCAGDKSTDTKKSTFSIDNAGYIGPEIEKY